MSIATLINRKTFEVSPNSTILDAAIAQNIVLEYSCKTGRCGVCKAHVQGLTQPVQTEEALTSLEEQQGYILTCCRVANSDLQLNLEDLPELAGLKPRTVPCRIDSKKLLNEDVLEVVLRTPAASTLAFLAGQHVSVIGPNGLRRSYSIANAPRQDGKIHLQIKKVEGGVFSALWFDQMAVNDLLRMEGPLGSFFVRSKPVKNLVFLATGTGIAPVKAMLEQLAARGHEEAVFSSLHVFFGGRSPQDLYWAPDENLLSNLNLTFCPVVSRPDETWQGETGHVQHAFLKYIAKQDLNLSETAVYACGSDAMIHSAKQALVQAGLPSQQFYSDAFVSTGS